MDQEKGTQLGKFKAGGMEFEMKPLNLKRLWILKGVMKKALDDLSKMGDESPIDSITDIFFRNYREILKILIPEKFMTDEFIDENIDLPLARTIMEQAIEINRLTDLWPFLKKMVSKGATS